MKAALALVQAKIHRTSVPCRSSIKRCNCIVFIKENIAKWSSTTVLYNFAWEISFQKSKRKMTISNKVSLITGNNGGVKNVNYHFEVGAILVCIQRNVLYMCQSLVKVKRELFLPFITKVEVSHKCANENKF